MTYISEETEESFFERYFEYGDDSDTARKNAGKALKIVKAANEKAEAVTASAENGECFDEAEAVLVFQTLSLANHYAKEFIASLPEQEQPQYAGVLKQIIG